MDDFFVGEEPAALLFCATCGRPLLGDPDEEPDGDAGRPMCGECRRSREFDEILAQREHDEWGRALDDDR